MLTQIRLLIQEQSDLCLYCLFEKKNISADDKTNDIVVIGALWVNNIIYM